MNLKTISSCTCRCAITNVIIHNSIRELKTIIIKLTKTSRKEVDVRFDSLFKKRALSSDDNISEFYSGGA
jgi:hypothetical protein